LINGRLFFTFLSFSLFFFYICFFFFLGLHLTTAWELLCFAFCYFLKESVRVVVSGLYLRCFLFACFLDVYELACCAFCTPPVCVCVLLHYRRRIVLGWVGFRGRRGRKWLLYIDSPTLSLVPYSFFFSFLLCMNFEMTWETLAQETRMITLFLADLLKSLLCFMDG
jgi:hypothetical protein